jgi:site-specific DNA recombinase
MNARPWVIYCRVSTEDQTHGVSMTIQEAQCRAMATAQQATVGALITDDASGKNLKRQGIQQVLEAMKAKRIAGVFVWKLDRLTRSLRDLVHIMELLDANGVALVSLHERIDTSGPMGRFTLHLFGSLAQFERETISQRVKASRDHLKAKGCWSGGCVPIGCRRIGERGNYQLEPDPATAPTVRAAVAAYLSGSGLNDLADLLHKGAALPRRPTATNVARLLRNPWLVSVGLISQAEADRAEAQLQSRNPLASNRDKKAPMPIAKSPKTARVWPLHGLAFCGRCGSAIIGATAKGRGNVVHAYLRCAGRNRRTCEATDLPAPAWESAIIRKVVAAANNGEWLQAWSSYSSRCLESSRVELDKRQGLEIKLNANQAAIARILTLVESGSSPLESARTRLAALETEARAIRESINSLGGAQIAAELAESQRAMMQASITTAASVLPTASPDQVNALLSGLVSRITIRDEPASIVIDLLIPRPLISEGGGFESLSHLVDRSGKVIEPAPVLRYEMRQVRRGQGYVVEDAVSLLGAGLK